MDLLRTTIAPAACAWLLLSSLACSSSEDRPAPGKSVTTGAFTVTTEVAGSSLVTRAARRGSDDQLTITFDRGAGQARIEPRFGQMRTVAMPNGPADVDAATQAVVEPITFAIDKTAAKADLGPRAVDLPPPACANPCFDACDQRFPDPAQNSACRFGCSNACTP